ncbi:MAG: ATP-binding protein, partial [Bacteroidales bacterium]|nr:ATP-binding protein [Bacteroidales bacterium]
MSYYQRFIDTQLKEWAESKRRKPLLVRGARQIGKTSTIRNLGKSFRNFVEIDLNDHTELHSLFDGGRTPQQICDGISLMTSKEIKPGKTLLFLDEIQACPAAINKLRYFYEQYPELHIVAAGSLLEFALEELPSFGVGRVESIFMYPFSFYEFLNASGNGMLCEAIKKANTEAPLLEPIHKKALDLLKTFIAIGGMPDVVATYIETGEIFACQKVLDTLAVSYKDDFRKYRKKINPELIRLVWESAAEQGQGKFVYSKISKDYKTELLKSAAETLVLAGLIHPIIHTGANGIPLGAEVNRKFCRMMLIDSGLTQRILGLNLVEFLSSDNMETINKGALAELFVGAELLKNSNCFIQGQLYCWFREEKGSNAEVDFVVQIGEKIVPIEVKSGSKGSMQSMRLFMDLKKSEYGIRTSLENFAQYE